jgi:RsiW-degrading membrane proteinase PrsW (M82 family)
VTGRRVVGVSLALLALGAAWLLVAGTPFVILLAAGLPTVAWAAVIVRIDRGRREPPAALVAALAGGALLAAGASGAINDAVLAWTGHLVGTTVARQWTPVLAAPVLEELAKAVVLAAVLYVWFAAFDNVLDGIVFGALVGLGFAMTENVRYFTLAAVQGGPQGLLQSLYLRAGLEGLIHPVCTAATGAGVGYAREAHSARSRWAAPAIGVGAAVLQHVAWNGVVSAAVTRLLCAAATPDGPCQVVPPPARLYVAVRAVIVAFLAPGVLILGAMARTRLSDAMRGRGQSPRGATRQPRT